ncbi:hypothetical protein FHS89_000017 [Rubricella aquisinus]|uniref:Uncharacterized protein n=1 Tax=Rubricella aquisinus TaxID=2028108 RepID=A0A840WFT0_9RHOB|nr:hypothetical protein [Rubricella aquisinus]MBB5514019.1 hypothetical protein [Rubricella aquisinus]
MLRLILPLLLLALPVWAEERTYYGALFVGSLHLGTDQDLNGENPGFGIGFREPSPWDGWEQSFEAGIFYNSYEEDAPYGIYALTRDLMAWEAWSLRGGAMVGAARYSALAPGLERDYGIPNLNGVIPIAGLVGVFRHEGGTDIRLKAVPPGGDVKMILALSLSHPF